jgi:hypothetical protein
MTSQAPPQVTGRWLLADDVDDPALSPLVRAAVKEFGWPRPEISEGDEVWFYEAEEEPLGFATFRCIPSYAVGVEDDWQLTHIWMRPSLRRQGRLRSVWREWRSRYGRFSLFEPNVGMESAAASLNAPRKA